MLAKQRAAGLADMFVAIAEQRPHRFSMELAFHAVDLVAAILISLEKGQFVDV